MALRTSIQNGVGRFTLARPGKRNAVNEQMRIDAQEGLALFAKEGIKVAILDAEGSVFCAGADTSEFDKRPTDPGAPPSLIDVVAKSGIFFVAAVGGPAIGLGLQLAVACSITVVSEEAWFSLPEVNIGMFPNGILNMITPLMEPKRGFGFAMSAQRLGARDALAAGLVTEVVPADQLAARAEEWARLLSVVAGSADRDKALSWWQTAISH